MTNHIIRRTVAQCFYEVIFTHRQREWNQPTLINPDRNPRIRVRSALRQAAEVGREAAGGADRKQIAIE
jgi:hypothetical protein